VAKVSKWDIEPAGVRAVLARVQGHAGDLNAALKSFGDDIESAAQGSQSRPVATALSEFLSANERKLSLMTGRISAAENGAAKATLAYLVGDELMAANAQSAAVVVAQTPVSQASDAFARRGRR
jgi:type II secretory pathway component PulM